MHATSSRALAASALSALALACAGAQRAAPPAPPSTAPADGPASPATPAPDEPVPALRLPEDVQPLAYRLTLEIDPAATTFRGEAEITIALGRARRVLWLNGRGLRVSSALVTADGTAPLRARYEEVAPEGIARLTLPAEVGPGRATLRVAWEADHGTLAGLFVSRDGRDAYAVTQLEPADARRVFPGFDDPRHKTRFDLSVVVPAGLVAVSNAPILSEAPAGDGRRLVTFARTEPLPTYLLFVGVGPFEVVEARPLPPGRLARAPVPHRALVPRGRAAEARFALETAAAVVPWLEEYFGIAFPYPKLDHVVAPEVAWGGMENPGAVLYAPDAFLASARASAEQRRLVAAVVAHELAHHWFGDLVTLPWWDEVWLNESLTTWLGLRAVDRLRPELGAGLDAVRRADRLADVDGLASARAVRRPLAAMSEVHDQFDGLSYEKGAAVLGGFERLLGEDRFRRGLAAYVASHASGTGSSAALLEALGRAADRDVADAVATFLDQPGVPLVAATLACGEGSATVRLAQRRWLPRGSAAAPEGRWGVPVCVVHDAGGGKTAERCALLDAAEGSLELGARCPKWILPAAGGAGYHRFTLGAAELRALRAEGLPRLGAAEKIALARSLRAAQRAGAVAWGEAFEVIAALARDPDPEVALEPALLLGDLHDRVLPPGARPAAAAAARRLYAPVLRRLGWTPRPRERAADARLRAAVVTLLAGAGDDAGVRREAARRGEALLAGRGADVPRDLVAPAVAAAVDAAGPGAAAAVERALERLGRLDEATRAEVLRGLGAVRSEPGAARVAAAWGDPRLRGVEGVLLLGALARTPAGGDAALGVLERELPAILARLPEALRASLPRAAPPGCDRAAAERLRAVFAPALAEAPEMARTLAQVVEEAEQCAVERAEDGAAAAEALARVR